MIDDAHLLADEELEQLAERVSDPGATVVVAAEPLSQRQALRALATALERENPVISLGALAAPDVAEAAASADRRPPCDGNRSGADGFDRGPAVPAPACDRRSGAAQRRACGERHRRGGQVRADRATAPSRRVGARHPAGVVSEPRTRPRRRRCGATAELRRGAAVGRPRPGQRAHRALTQPGVSARRSISASPRSSALPAITTSRSRCSARRSN